MDFVSSPLPSSGLPGPTPSSPASSRSLNRRRGGGEIDAPGPEAVDDTAAAAAASLRRRRPKGAARNQQALTNDVPPVKDTTGEAVTIAFEDFLTGFTEEVDLMAEDDMDIPHTPRTPGSSRSNGNGSTGPIYPYIKQLEDLAADKAEHSTLYVDFTHLFSRDETLARAISDQYFRFAPYLKRALFNLVKIYIPQMAHTNSNQTSGSSRGGIDAGAQLQTRDFSVAFHSLPLVSAIRDLRTGSIGKLTAVSGTVTRTSEVRPELIFGTFRCENCSALVPEVEQQFKYTEPLICPNPTCGNRRAWTLKTESSRFSDWQKVRIQENPADIPTGSMPRSLDVILRGDVVEKAKAGDKCVFTGTFIVVPDVSQLGLPGVNSEMQRDAARSGGGGAGANGAGGGGIGGLKALGVRDLQYKTAFLACMVNDTDPRTKGVDVRPDLPESKNMNQKQQEYINTLTEPEVQELVGMVQSEYIYSRLVGSIAPTVYGHETVKKGLLLQLLGGVHKQTPEGMHLRGDINICIVGDPSTSKSQFLKYVCSFLPRAVYTSGKASSAAGLTAAVVKDEESGEFTIEAGALMLADNGICAIDEFDKMDMADQVAIHEAMEQQTISIAKAGIHATLNARTSILAAANPIGGRYNRKQSLRQNVGMSAPIMSRFDLFFVVLDEQNAVVDENLARHIVNVHRFQSEAITPEFSTEALQRYIRFARTFDPKFTPEASEVLIDKYRILRQDDSTGVGKNSYRITVRQLESMIRLSEAIARANCTNVITPEIVREAFSLLKQSIIHVEQDDIDFDEDDDATGPPTNPNAAAAAAAHPGDDGAEMALVGEDDEITQEELDAIAKAEASFNTGSSTFGATTGTGTGTGAGMGESTQEMDSMSAQAGSLPRTSGRTASTPAPAGHPSSTPAPVPQAKRKFKITYEQYTSMQTLILLHLASVERATGRGMDRDDLIDWYLEQKEAEISNEEEVEYETELVGKVLGRLVKDNSLIAMYGELQDSLPADSADGSMQVDGAGAVGTKQTIHYMVHPSVDIDLSSSAL